MLPASRSNSVLQLNMGEGKTSCIIPIALAVLANGQSLTRVVVLKSFLLQTAQLLHARLGGLWGREIHHIPFSRKTPTNPSCIRAYCDIQKAVCQSSGVMVTVPDHILSFKLGGL